MESQKKKTICKACKIEWTVLLTHLNKVEKCKIAYGTEYNTIKLKKTARKERIYEAV